MQTRLSPYKKTAFCMSFFSFLIKPRLAPTLTRCWQSSHNNMAVPINVKNQTRALINFTEYSKETFFRIFVARDLDTLRYMRNQRGKFRVNFIFRKVRISR